MFDISNLLKLILENNFLSIILAISLIVGVYFLLFYIKFYFDNKKNNNQEFVNQLTEENKILKNQLEETNKVNLSYISYISYILNTKVLNSDFYDKYDAVFKKIIKNYLQTHYKELQNTIEEFNKNTNISKDEFTTMVISLIKDTSNSFSEECKNDNISQEIYDAFIEWKYPLKSFFLNAVEKILYNNDNLSNSDKLIYVINITIPIIDEVVLNYEDFIISLNENEE